MSTDDAAIAATAEEAVIADSRDVSASDDDLVAFFGPAFGAVNGFYDLLVEHGVERGLIGPREVDRLWSRHILNSAAVVPFLPQVGVIVDLGSGAGLPGVVIAAMLPEAEIVLVEPMERRCAWLAEVIDELGLTNTTVRRGRAEEFADALEADAVTARAVAGLSKLAGWAFPLLRVGGELVALKGRTVDEEIVAAGKVLRKYGVENPEVHTATTLPGLSATTVVRARRSR